MVSHLNFYLSKYNFFSQFRDIFTRGYCQHCLFLQHLLQSLFRSWSRPLFCGIALLIFSLCSSVFFFISLAFGPVPLPLPSGVLQTSDVSELCSYVMWNTFNKYIYNFVRPWLCVLLCSVKKELHETSLALRLYLF